MKNERFTCVHFLLGQYYYVNFLTLIILILILKMLWNPQYFWELLLLFYFFSLPGYCMKIDKNWISCLSTTIEDKHVNKWNNKTFPWKDVKPSWAPDWRPNSEFLAHLILFLPAVIFNQVDFSSVWNLLRIDQSLFATTKN